MLEMQVGMHAGWFMQAWCMQVGIHEMQVGVSWEGQGITIQAWHWLCGAEEGFSREDATVSICAQEPKS